MTSSQPPALWQRPHESSEGVEGCFGHGVGGVDCSIRCPRHRHPTRFSRVCVTGGYHCLLHAGTTRRQERGEVGSHLTRLGSGPQESPQVHRQKQP